MTAYSPTGYTGDGSTTDFTVSWPYLDAEHVECYLDGVETSLFSIPTVGTIRFNTAPGASVAISIKRNTPTVPEAVWNDGAVILGADLNTAFLQSLYIAEEAEARTDETIALDTSSTWWDAENKEIRDVATPTLAQSVTTKAYVDNATSVAQVGYAEEWANKAEDSLVSSAAGGNGIDEYSALHHAAKASTSASAASTSASAASASASAASASASAASASASAAATSESNLATALATAISHKNYIVNPGMRVSQENGSTSSTTNSYYPVDQWVFFHSQDGTLTTQQVSSATPGGSENRIRMTVTSADTSIAAGQFAAFIQHIEGLRTADLQWGTTNATDVVLRFGFKGPAGTYAVTIRNQDNNRSFVREFTISGGDANTDTLQTLTFPGDTSGTWDKDNTLSLSITFTFATGSTYQTTADSWQAGNYFGTSSTSNGIGTTSDVFELFDVGLYADPDSTGVAPRFELPHYDTDLQECMRYYEAGNPDTNRLDIVYSYVTSGSFVYHYNYFSVQKRSAPSMTVTDGMNINFPAGNPTVTFTEKEGFRIYKLPNGTGQGYFTYSWVANARL